MVRISLSYLYQLAENLDPLSRLPDQAEVKLKDIFFQIITADHAINSLIVNSVFSASVRSSRQSAQDLLDALRFYPTDGFDIESIVDSYKIFHIKNAYEQYKVALLAELGVTPAFFVAQKGSHDTLSLLDNAETLFPASLRTKVPETTFDVAEVGKALAYELPTACGFHVFRVTESVLRRYYSKATSNAQRPKVRSISIYVKSMRNIGVGDEKVLSSLEQLAKLHRNPVIHPDVALSTDEALSIIGIARSVIAAMLDSLPETPQTTEMVS